MNRWHRYQCAAIAPVIALIVAGSSGCGGNSEKDAQSPTVTAVFPDASNLKENSPVRLGDVTIGKVTEIRWAPQPSKWLVTLQLKDEIVVPANVTATLSPGDSPGSVVVELIPHGPPRGKLTNGQTIDGSR